MKEDLKVSFCVPTYNKEIWLAACLDSIISQTYKNIEVIVVDDCSTDGTSLLMKYFVNKYKFIKYFVNDKNMGVGWTRNKARSMAKGDIICVQDADDLSTEFRAMEVVKFFKENKKIDIVYGACAVINGLGAHIATNEAQEFSINRLKNENFIQHPTVAYRSSVRVPYREIRYIDDWYFYMDCVREGLNFGRINQILGIYRPPVDGLTLKDGFSNEEKIKAKNAAIKEFEVYDDAVGFHMIDKKNQQYIRMREILRIVPSGSRVLDVGCNDGTLMEQLIKKGCQVEGIDKAINLVNMAVKKGLKVSQVDIVNTKLDKQFNYIVLADILEHFTLEDIAKIINNCRAMLKKDGKFVITVPYKHGGYNKAVISDHKTDINAEMLALLDATQKPICLKGNAVPVWLIITGR